MKPPLKLAFRRTCLVLLAIAPTFLTGCLFKSEPISTRHFILASVSTNAEPPVPPASGEGLSVGIAPVRMPSHLLRDSLAVRNSANEIEYLEGAQWGERLDQSFQRTVAANLSRLLLTDHVYATDWARNQVTRRIFINVQQFEVDTQGHGTLLAHWRITAPDSDSPLKTGTLRLERTGPSPRGNPAVIPATLSDLTAEFSRELAKSIHESSKGRDQSEVAVPARNPRLD